MGRASGKSKAEIYARVSAKANAESSSVDRQRASCRETCKKAHMSVALSVAEVVSGSLPMDKRANIMSLLGECKRKGIKHIVVENSRALSRSASSAEHMFQASQAAGVQIVASFVPELYSHNSNPAQRFLRRVICAYAELEKDMVVNRLQHGLTAKRKKVQQRLRQEHRVAKTQAGGVKVNGRKSILQTKRLSKYQRTKMLTLCKKLARNEITLRPLALAVKKLLRLPTCSHETARRMCAEFLRNR